MLLHPSRLSLTTWLTGTKHCSVQDLSILTQHALKLVSLRHHQQATFRSQLYHRITVPTEPTRATTLVYLKLQIQLLAHRDHRQ